MGMLAGSTLAHVGMGVKRACGDWMIDVGLMEDLWRYAWGYRHPRWI